LTDGVKITLLGSSMKGEGIAVPELDAGGKCVWPLIEKGSSFSFWKIHLPFWG
jgi:hypothetical protein